MANKTALDKLVTKGESGIASWKSAKSGLDGIAQAKVTVDVWAARNAPNTIATGSAMDIAAKEAQQKYDKLAKNGTKFKKQQKKADATIYAARDEIAQRTEYMEVIHASMDDSQSKNSVRAAILESQGQLAKLSANLPAGVSPTAMVSEVKIPLQKTKFTPLLPRDLSGASMKFHALLEQRERFEKEREREQAKVEKLRGDLTKLKEKGEVKAVLEAKEKEIKEQVKQVKAQKKKLDKVTKEAKQEGKAALKAVTKGKTDLEKNVKALEEEQKKAKKQLESDQKSAKKLQDKLITTEGVEGSTKDLKKLAELTLKINNTKEFIEQQAPAIEAERERLELATKDVAVMQEASKNLIPLDKAKEKVAEAAPETPAQEAEQTQTPEAGSPATSATPDSPEQTDIVAPQEVAAKMDELTNKVNQTQEKLFDEFAKKEFAALGGAAGQTYEDFKKANLKELKTKAEQNQDYLKELASAQKPIYAEMHKALEKVPKIAWEKTEDNTPHTQTFKDAEGKKICDIKTTTKKDNPPLKIKTASGKSVEIKARRELELPRNLEPGQGPRSMSFALKDQNGNNMPAKDALYFNANYDESGKLTNLTVPQPVKFSGKGKDAAAYVEVEGKIFTLPVSRGELEGLQQEVAKNKGVAQAQTQDLAQDVMQQGAPAQAQSVQTGVSAPEPTPLEKAELEKEEAFKQMEAANAARIDAQSKFDALNEMPPGTGGESAEWKAAKAKLDNAQAVFDAAEAEAEAAAKVERELKNPVVGATPEELEPAAATTAEDIGPPATPPPPIPDDVPLPPDSAPEVGPPSTPPSPEAINPSPPSGPPPMDSELSPPPPPPRRDDVEVGQTPPTRETAQKPLDLGFDAEPTSLKGHKTDARIFGDPAQPIPSGPTVEPIVPPTPRPKPAPPEPATPARSGSTTVATPKPKPKNLRPAVAAVTTQSPARKKPEVARVAGQARGALVELRKMPDRRGQTMARNRTQVRDSGMGR